MDASIYRIRPFETRDYPLEAMVHHRVAPDFIMTAEEMRHFDEEVFGPPLTNLKLTAEEISRGEAIAFGYLFSDLESSDPRTFWAEVAVDPSHQGRGVGLALASRVQDEANQRHARRLWAGARMDDTRALDFFAKQGFVERRRAWRSRVELATAPTVPDRTDELGRLGFTFSTLAQEDVGDPRLVRELYDLSVATSADEPRLGEYTPITFEQFVKRDLGGPGFLADAFFLARKNGRLVAMSTLWRSNGEPGALHQSYTATLREFRGLGVATELKRRTIEYGRTHGFRYIRTGNDSRNLPMLAINRKIGYRPEVMRVFGEKILGA